MHTAQHTILHVTGVSSVGCGTAELSLRLTSSGFDFADLLPAGAGELSRNTKLREDKAARAAERAQAALDALERERLRRAQEKEDKDRLRQQRELEQQLRQDEEERILFRIANELRVQCLSRAFKEEKSKAFAECERCAEMFKRLSTLREKR
jgi:hypothetical protein